MAALTWIALSTLVSCTNDSNPGTPSIDWDAIDDSLNPCDDFYAYACGGWKTTHPVGSSGSYRSRFDDAYYALVPKLRAIIESDARGERAPDDPNAQLIGDLYTSCMDAPNDVGARDRLRSMLQPIMSIGSIEDLARQVAAQRELGSGTFFFARVAPDPGDPTRMVLVLDQGGFELENRADYLDAARAALRSAYRQHIVELKSLLNDTAIDPDQAIGVETALAQASLDPADRRDPRALYHPMRLDELTALTPAFPWDTYFTAAGLDSVTDVVVAVPDYFVALNRLFEEMPLPALRSYMAWQLLQDEAAKLDAAVVQTNFAFWSENYSGQAVQAERSWLCYQSVLSALGTEVSRPYVARFFDAKGIRTAKALVTELRAGVGRHLGAASWLDDTTRAEAMTKLDAMNELIGYPDEWPNDDGLELSPSSYLMNLLHINQFGHRKAAAMLGEPAKRNAWSFSPVTVNAQYLWALNAIEVPAGILAPPFFATDNPAASNYGGIGTVMAHELTHGFDDQGRSFDAGGALRDWWSAGAEAAFGERAQCLIDQFSSYSVEPGLAVDGELTLGENIADLGGVSIAYDALLRAHPHEPASHGYDARQQFFLEFAQLYCENVRPELLRQTLMRDPHSPSAIRVNGTLVNVPGFAKAFACRSPAPATAAVGGRAPGCQIW